MAELSGKAGGVYGSGLLVENCEDTWATHAESGCAFSIVTGKVGTYCARVTTTTVGADVVINTAGTVEAFKECLNFVRNSGTVVEVGNFVDSGTFDFNPCKDLLEKGITIIGSFDNEAEHFVRSMPLIADERIPLEKLITHRVSLGDVQRSLEAINKNEKLNGKEIVKIMMDPTLPEGKGI